jgi:hypothetical protein
VIDTIKIGDSVISIDTIILIDSSIVFDTVIVYDTTIRVDTVIIIDPSPNEDTVYVYDTTYIVDTIKTVDTVIVIDTVTDVDTVVIVDTVTDTDTVVVIDTQIVEVPDSSGSPVVCARLGTYQQEILWMFRNDAGDYRLEFVAVPEKENPARELTVNIAGQTYPWTPQLDRELIVETALPENAAISIFPAKPSPYGHAIDICLTMKSP